MMASLMSVPKSHYVEIFSIVVLCEGCVQRPHMANPECVGAPGLFEVRKTSWEYLEYSTPTSVRAKYLKQCKSTRNHYRSKSDRADYISMLLRGHWLQSYSDESALITDYEHKDKGKGKDENKVLYFLKAGGSRISTTSFPVSYQYVPSLPSMFIWTKESGSARGPFQPNLVQFPLPRSHSVFQFWRNVVAGLQGGH